MTKTFKTLMTAASILFATRSVIAAGPTTQPAAEPLQYTMKNIDGKETDLAQYKGKVVMIINVASKCGFTKQYTGLEKLYEKYKDQGFVILGFPANNFKGQEPGSDEEIKTFCTATYGVTFPIFSKISVAGTDQSPLYKLLTEPATNGQFAGPIGWNFTKFLVGKDGHVYARFASKVTPEDKELVGALEDGLKK
ncbi:MAG: glutathione peroxidase [Tepidisphaeraceae bacterium]